MSVGVILMSRAPIPGQTKTRLQTHLTGEDCARLHKAFLQDLSQMLTEVSEARDNINLYLTYTPQGKKDMFDDLVADDFHFFAQRGSNLGAKMYHALDYVACENDKQIILGSDLPTLQPSVILAAIDKLERQDLVVGPSQDGGYYLLATKEPASFLFNDIIFGENDVLQATIKEIKEHNLSYGLVDTWSDIDIYPELVELYQELIIDSKWESYPQTTADLVTDLLEDDLMEGGKIYGRQAK
ncbi:TIGR04282 family arsenosugar biosynthesis glycosyltransferase [Halanaerocella petrolearia]